jgi:hypothetical protein
MKLPPIEPVIVHCALHGTLLVLLKGLYLILNIFMTSNACEWALLTALAWFILDSCLLWRDSGNAERGLIVLIDKCESSLAAIRDLAMRYESIDRRCQAANFRHLRARDSSVRELNWVAFCRRCLILEHAHSIRRGNQRAVPRTHSDGDIATTSLSLERTHSIS